MPLTPGRAVHATCRLVALALGASAWAQTAGLPGTAMLTGDIDRSEEMRAGMERYLEAATTRAVADRPARWQRDFSSAEAYARSVAPNRERLTRALGCVDTRMANPQFALVGTVNGGDVLARTARFTVHAVRWPVYDDVEAEGLLLRPVGAVKARVVALPDADQTPEAIAGLTRAVPAEAQFARRLAEAGCEVIVPALVSRADTFSGSERLKRFTNQPHREWIYRQAYTFGRHIIGYEVDQVRAAVDWFARREPAVPIGVAGWGEGGLLAFYGAALDERIAVTLVGGYFGPREALWAEPIYRNVFGLLREFGDAEIASLIAPRVLLVEPSAPPQVVGPPAAREGRRASAASGAITRPALAAVRAELERGRALAGPFGEALRLPGDAGRPMEEASLQEFLRALGVATETPPAPAEPIASLAADAALVARQRRRVAVLEEHTQALIERSRVERDARFWKPTEITTPVAWDAAMRSRRAAFWDDLIGRLPRSDAPLNVRSRVLYDRADSTGYEVVLDALPGVTLWGYLLLPKSLGIAERRPVVVAQHGLSGVPADLLNDDRASRTHRVYQALATQLVQRGYVVFVPHFPWRTQEDYRRLQRKANPLGLSVFSFILAHHTRLLDWLERLPFVDPARIGLYGLSWGGKVAMRVPALERRYALSICSGDFNDWIWKNATTDWPNSYMFAPEPDMFDFNLGPTFSHAEMAAMIAPRAFMVERGHDDGVGTDERVAAEYARVFRLYNKLGIPERTAIEYFDGGHQINAVGTFHFLQRHFNWPRHVAPKP